MIRLFLEILAAWLVLDIAVLVILAGARRRERRLARGCAERVIRQINRERNAR